MASMFSKETPYMVDGLFYSKSGIVDMHRKIQSAHDKDKSLEFSCSELAVKRAYKTIQSARDSERIKASRLAKQAETNNIEVGISHIELLKELAPYQLHGVSYTKTAIVHWYKQIQSAHDKAKNREFTPDELQIKQWHKEIQSQHDSERLKAIKVVRNDESSEEAEEGATGYHIDGKDYSADEILAKYYAIQSLHAKDKSLEFTPHELQIKKWRQEIQSQRDSARLRARRETTTPIDGVLVEDPALLTNLVEMSQKLIQLKQMLSTERVRMLTFA